jgi:hypothetical protein
MKIHIHVGVHKTATTYIQGRLGNTMFKLNKSGIGYFPLWKFRASFWKDFASIDPDGFRFEDHLLGFFPRLDGKPDPEAITGIIISEENLLGQCGTFVNTGQLFPTANARLAHLRRLLGKHEVTMFCALRSYDTFLASAYCEGLRTNRKYVNFETFRARLDWERLHWPSMVAGFEESLQPDYTVLWSYETFRAQTEQITAKLAFGIQLSPTKAGGDTPTYSSMSQTAIEAIDAVAQRCGDEVAGSLVRTIGEALPKAEGHPSFDPWEAEERKRLQKLYAAHCQEIPAGKWLNPVAERGVWLKVA